MDVAAAGLLPRHLVIPTHPAPRTKSSGPRRRSAPPARRHPRLSGINSIPAPMARLGFEPWGTTRSRAPLDGKRLWERFGDDRDLAGAKVALLAALLILTAVLEWVV